MKNVLYVGVDSSPLPTETEELVCLDCNLEYLFAKILEDSIISKYSDVVCEGVISNYKSENIEVYRQIIVQWENIIGTLIEKECKGVLIYPIKLPMEYREWLRWHDNESYREIGEKIECDAIDIPVQQLYDWIIKDFLINRLVLYFKKGESNTIRKIVLGTNAYTINEELRQMLGDIEFSPLKEWFWGNKVFLFEHSLRNIVGVFNYYKDRKRQFDIFRKNAIDYGKVFAAKELVPFRFIDGWAVLKDYRFDALLNINGLMISGYTPLGFSEGMAPLWENDKWGFVDYASNWVIKPRFDDVLLFSEGLAAVKINGKWGYINKDGEMVIPYMYHIAKSFSNGLAVVVSQHGESHESFFINRKGEKVIDGPFENADSFSENFALVQKNGYWGCIDKNGKTVVPFMFDKIKLFSEGHAVVCDGWHWGYVNKDGKIVIPEKYDQAYDFSNGLAHVIERGCHCYIDVTGRIVARGFYDACDYSEGYALVQNPTNGKWGYIDTKGIVVVPYIFDDASSFSEGRALVKKDGRVGYIDRQWIDQEQFHFDCCQEFLIICDGRGPKNEQELNEWLNLRIFCR